MLDERREVLTSPYILWQDTAARQRVMGPASRTLLEGNLLPSDHTLQSRIQEGYSDAEVDLQATYLSKSDFGSLPSPSPFAHPFLIPLMTFSPLSWPSHPLGPESCANSLRYVPTRSSSAANAGVDPSTLCRLLVYPPRPRRSVASSPSDDSDSDSMRL